MTLSVAKNPISVAMAFRAGEPALLNTGFKPPSNIGSPAERAIRNHDQSIAPNAMGY